MTRWEAHNRLKRVRNGLDAARFAVGYALDTWDAPGGAFERAERVGLARSELSRLNRDLETTFIVRLVAAFEGILRDYRENGLKKKPTRVDLGPLIDQIARKRDVDTETLAGAHEVRAFRNDVVHRDLQTPRLDFAGCASALGTFVAWLPPQW